MTGMRPLGDLISLDEALRICDDAAVPITRTERLTLEEVTGRVLASDIVAKIDVPPFMRSAMDGYAVRLADFEGKVREDRVVLKIVEKIFAGSVPKNRLKRMECAEIATGGMLPDSADGIVIVEDSERRGEDSIAILAAPIPGKNIISPGSDIKRGEIVAKRGDLLTPGKIGAIASVGIEEIEVFRRPSVSVMPTGNEVIRPGKRLGRGQIYDINTFTLNSTLIKFGADVSIRPIVDDSREGLLEAINSGRDSDIVVFSGGSSVGERDLIADAIRELGELLFHGVAIKPGKPTILGKVRNTLILGMPGHPASCLSNSYVFLKPIIGKIGRFPKDDLCELNLELAEEVRSPKGKTHIMTVRISGKSAIPAFKESSAITSIANADGFFLIPPDIDHLEKDSIVTVTLF